MIEVAIAALVIASLASGLGLWLFLRGWPASLTLTAKTKEGLVSLGAGLEISWLSANAAAILGGPGVIVLQLGSRRLYEKRLDGVTVEAALAWIESLLDAPDKPPPGYFGRLAARMKNAVVARTDLGALPELGTRIALGLRDPRLGGTVICGFSDPALTGKAAAVLFPLAGMLAPVSSIELRFDWSGRTVLDFDVEGSCRIVPARIAREAAWFVWNHVHYRPRLQSAEVSHTLPA